jgi:hypothetical protein
MATDACELTFGVSLTAKCIRCKVTRDVDDAELTLQESSSDTRTVKASCVVVSPTACECGETRVRVRAKLEFG